MGPAGHRARPACPVETNHVSIPRRKAPLFASLILVASLIGGGAALWQAQAGLSVAVPLTEVAYVGSAGCADCHADRHDSWHRTYHRTMTQAAGADSVVGQFDGRELRAFGGLVRPIRTDQGYAFEYRDAATGELQAILPVLRTVGSHRYQQYLTRDAGSETYYRLHYLWHIGEQRWVHMNAAFLGDDQQPFDAQVATWNANCVNCHNTGPVPAINNLQTLRERALAGEQFDVRDEMRFDTRVAELGIGCEACHGPGAEHTRRMEQSALRAAARWLGVRDTSIVNPERLPVSRANDVCGACHAGRTLADTAALDCWLTEGPQFRPGDDLAQHVLPVSADTPAPAAAPDLFRNRFWHDGTVRLTAYEYQALNASACAAKGELSCIDCHTMHGGDPAGMLPEANRGDAPCLRCHQDLRARIVQHSGHPADSAGARCMSCHMPREVYGVMTMHRSHDISIPDVASSLAAGKPDACLNCHVTEAPAFALRGDDGKHLGFLRQDGGDLALADGLVGLIAGDPVRQAVAAFELGRVEQAPSVDELPLRAAWLIAALEDDRPAVRRFALRSLAAVDTALAGTPRALGLAPWLAQFDYTGDGEQRAASLAAIAARFAAIDKSGWPRPPAASALDADYRLDPAVLARLRELGARSDKQIDVGE
jgi:predicted CXXCH cytochrome family protein